jgi:hypothetical protein
MDAVFDYIRENKEKLNDNGYGGGAVLGVYVGKVGKKDKFIMVPFVTEDEADRYLETVLPESLQGSAVVVAVNYGVCLMV